MRVHRFTWLDDVLMVALWCVVVAMIVSLVAGALLITAACLLVLFAVEIVMRLWEGCAQAKGRAPPPTQGRDG